MKGNVIFNTSVSRFIVCVQLQQRRHNMLKMTLRDTLRLIVDSLTKGEQLRMIGAEITMI